MKEYSGGLLRAVSINTISSVISRFFSIGSSVYIARSLDKSEFGIYAFVISTAYLISNLSSYGLNTYAAKLVAENRVKGFDVRRMIVDIELVAVFLSVTGVLLALFFSSHIVSGIHDAYMAKDMLMYSMLFAGAFTFSGVQSSILFGMELFRVTAISGILVACLGSFLQIVLFSFGGINGAVVGLGVAQLVGCLFMQYCLRRELVRFSGLAENPSAFFLRVKRIIKQLTPVFLSGIMVFPVTWLIDYILAQQENGVLELAALSLANQWKMAILFVPSILASVAMPRMVYLHKQGDVNSFNKFIVINLLINVLVGLGLLLLVAIVANFLGLIYGDAYAEDGGVFIGIAVVAVLMAANNVIGQILTCKNLLWHGFLFNALWAIAIMLFAFMFVVVLQQGAMGVVYAYLCAYSLHCIWQFSFIAYLSKRKVVVV